MTEATLSAKVTADIADFAKKMDELKGSVEKTASASQASLTKLAMPDLKLTAGSSIERFLKETDQAIAKVEQFGTDGANQIDLFQTHLEGVGEQMTLFRDDVGLATTQAVGDLGALAERGGGALDRLREKLAMPETKLLATTITSTAAAVEGSFFAITKSVAASTEQIEQISQKTGIASATLEGWLPILNRTGTSVDSFAVAYRALSKDITDAQAGNEKAVEKFNAMGLAVDQLGDTEAVLAALADRLVGIENPAQRAQLAVDLLGRSGLALLPALLAGKQGFAESAQQAQAWGAVLDQVAREKLLAFDDSLDNVGTALGGFKNQVAIAVSPSLQVIADAVLGILGWFNSLSDGVKQIVSVFTTAFAAAGPIVAAAAGVAAALGVAIAPIVIGGAVITALIAAVTLIIANWQKIKDTGAALWQGLAGAVIGAVTQLVGGVDVAIARLSAILDGVKAKTDAVKGFFQGLYSAVVGRSYIPDMVDGVQAEMQRLEGSAMVDPTARAVQQTADQVKAFEINMTSGVRNATTQTAKILEGAAFTWSGAFSQVATTAVNTWGSITQTVGTSLAKMTDEHVQWGEVVKQLGLQVLGAMIAQFIQIAAQWAISQFTMTAAQQVQDTARAAASTAADAARIVSSTSADAAIVASFTAAAGAQMSTMTTLATAWATMTTAMTVAWDAMAVAIGASFLLAMAGVRAATLAGVISTLAGIGAVGNAAMATMGAVVAATSAVFAAIAAALAASVVGVPLAPAYAAAAAAVGAAGGAAVGVGIGAIQAALGTAVATATAALATPFAHGGIVTGPTLALIGEAGPEAVVPLRGRSAASGMMGGEQTIIIQLDGRQIARATFPWLPGEVRLRAGAIA